MNERGFSWLEAMLALTVLMVIFGTLLPFVTKMTTKLTNKRFSMYAAETAFHGAIAYQSYGKVNGTRHVEGVDYTWRIESDTICIEYVIGRESLIKCLDY